MSIDKKVIRLLADGPVGSGLSNMALDADEFQSDLPEQYVYEFFKDANLGLTVGVWTTTTMQEIFGPYPGDEVVVILDGQAEMVDAQGQTTPINSGVTACITNGLPISWKQTGFLWKFLSHTRTRMKRRWSRAQ